MMRVLLIWFLSLALCGGGALLAAERPNEPIDVVALGASAELEVDAATGLATGPNGVMVRQGNTVLTARRVLVDRLTGWVTAEGDVQLQGNGQLWRSETLKYNFRTQEVQGETFRTGQAPFFASGDGLTSVGTNHLSTATNGYFTSDDLAEPGYRVKARKLSILPGQYIEADGATFYLGKVPVMYFPHYRRSMERHLQNWVLLPGYRSIYGGFLLTEYNWYWNDQLDGTIHLDLRQRRGAAAGPDFRWRLGELGDGDIALYGLRDEDPRAGLSPQTATPDRDRYQLNFTHRVMITSNLTARAVIRKQGDPTLQRDFFEDDYRKNIQPPSFLEAEQLWPNFSLNALAMYQINDFYQTVERLPDVKLDAVRQQLGISPFYYESDSSLGYLRFQDIAGQGTNYAAWRGDTFHQVVLPNTFFGWLNVTPRVGGRFTHYGEVEGSGTTAKEQDRWVFNTGAEVSTRLSRVWAGATNRLLQVDGLRHIFEPSVNYVYVPEPDRRPLDLPQFDYELHTLRLLPVDYPDYNAIDSIDSQNVLRIQLRNRLQTHRELGSQNLVNWSLYTDWRLKPRAGQGTFADFFSDLDFAPRHWFYVSSLLRYNSEEGQLRESDHRVTLVPNDTVSWGIGHRYLRDDPTFGPDYGNNLFYSTVYFRLNENWGFRMRHQFEARDGTMEDQSYTFYRDMRSWTTAVTFRLRDSRSGPQDVSVGVTLSLKAIPRFKLGKDSVEPSLIHGT